MAQPLWLRIEGARQNNLKNVSVALPHDRVTVITGVSGSGKSSLAFDTIFAEGQWRYIESLSAYARMFLEPLEEHAGVGGERLDAVALHRVALRLRPHVPRAARPPRRGSHRAHPARHRARAEESRADSPLHGGHGHRAPRLPPPALRQGGPGPLPALRKRGTQRLRGAGSR